MVWRFCKTCENIQPTHENDKYCSKCGTKLEKVSTINGTNIGENNANFRI